MTTLTRRQFLKNTLAGIAMFALRDIPLTTETLTIPPALMLHSRHHEQLPELLEMLSERGYMGINYHDLLRASKGEIRLPKKPILISIDDITMVKGNPGFKIFRKMKNALVSYGFRGSFAVITRPDLPQDEDLWAEAAEWQGISLESHTSYHSNLDNPNFTEVDYQAEIVDSTALIEQYTGKSVSALITPFGSGYDAVNGYVKEPILAACQDARLPFVVGIVGGRGVLPPTEHTAYMGRATMGLDDRNASGLFEVENW
jgi:hypothetical protein